ncbi:MAG: NusG domain II-containing protein [Ruminococcus sp.]|nr:NusG domain II-containing protein [Ruminococcus sp.]
MKNRIWVIIFSVVILICVAIYIVGFGSANETDIVGIYSNSKLVEKIDLSKLDSERKITISGENGTNVILAQKNSIKMISAECPDKVCVNHGELKKGGAPIICLPNKLVIRWENSSDEYDVKTGV